MTRIDIMTRMGKVIIAMSEFIVKPKEDCGGEVCYRHIQLEGVEGSYRIHRKFAPFFAQIFCENICKVQKFAQKIAKTFAA